MKTEVRSYDLSPHSDSATALTVSPMLETWLLTDWSSAGLVLLSVAVVYSAVILYARISGLRSFSKMSASDFAMTVAVGSLLGSSIVAKNPPALQAVVALGGLFFGQWLIAFLRTRLPFTSKLFDNTPVLLMSGSEILDDNLKAVNMSRDDLAAKLREANVWRLDQIKAVVFETTGDVTVLHGPHDENDPIDDLVMRNVRDSDKTNVS